MKISEQIGVFLLALTEGQSKSTHSWGTTRGIKQGGRFTSYFRILTSSPFRGTIRATIGAIILVAIFLLGVGEAQAQTTAVCSNTPAAGERIVCEQDAASTNNIDIDTSNLTISTTAVYEDGIEATHSGSGDIKVNSQMDSITTTGNNAFGIDVNHMGSGDIKVNSQSDSITTTGNNAYGIDVNHMGASGDVTVRVTSPTIMMSPSVPVGTPGSIGIAVNSASIGKLDVDIQGGSITANGGSSTGVLVWHAYQGTGDAGPTTLDINDNAAITTLGDYSEGVLIFRRSDGQNILNLKDVTIGTMGIQSFGVRAEQDFNFDRDIVGDVEVNMLGGVSITTEGQTAHGVYVVHAGENTAVQSDVVVKARGRNTVTTSGKGAHGLYGVHRNVGAGKVRMDLRDIAITTKGASAEGILGDHLGIGDIEFDVRNATIVTESIVLDPSSEATLSHGILAFHRNLGDVDIDVQGGSIETRGAYSYGVYGLLLNTEHGGMISIRTGGGHAITTTGANGHGIVAYNFGTLGTSAISIDVGGNITTTGEGSQGVRVGTLSSGALGRVAAIGDDGYRRQTVTVDGAVTSAAEGVYLAGGGRVVIGRRGSIRSGAGIAILATGDTPGAGPSDPPLKPKLRVDMNLGGRRVAQAIGDDWIVNDGGETTIAVNRVVLHDGETGVTGRRASNGAWNVRMREEGVAVDRTQANWRMSEPTAGVVVVADRDFSAQDFNERRKPPPPPPPMCPEGQVGTPPDCTTPPPPMCPPGQVGTPPDCTIPPPPMCPPDKSGRPRTALFHRRQCVRRDKSGRPRTVPLRRLRSSRNTLPARRFMRPYPASFSGSTHGSYRKSASRGRVRPCGSNYQAEEGRTSRNARAWARNSISAVSRWKRVWTSRLERTPRVPSPCATCRVRRTSPRRRAAGRSRLTGSAWPSALP